MTVSDALLSVKVFSEAEQAQEAWAHLADITLTNPRLAPEEQQTIVALYRQKCAEQLLGLAMHDAFVLSCALKTIDILIQDQSLDRQTLAAAIHHVIHKDG